jgi:hypothetical protein
VNQEMYVEILRRLRDAVRRKFPQKMENQELGSSSRQCSSTPVSFSQIFLNNEQCDNTGASSTIEAGITDFYLLPRLKSALQRRRFCDGTDIIRNATEELKRLSQTGTLPTNYSRWQKCILFHWEYFEENVAYTLIRFGILIHKLIPRKF